MKLVEIRRFDDQFYDLADNIKEGITRALVKTKHLDVIEEYEDTIKSIAYAATEELIERVAEVEHRIKKS